MGERERANRRFGCELNGYRDAECQEPSMPRESLDRRVFVCPCVWLLLR